MNLPSTLPAAGLLAFWDFQEPTGSPRMARGPHPCALRDGGEAVPRVHDGVFGAYSADLAAGRWLVCPPLECAGLNLHGPAAQVTVLTWIKPRRQVPPWCEFIAGIWDERAMRRQYGLFLGLGLAGVAPNRQVCGHVSSTGGHSPGLTYCDSSSSGQTPVPNDSWSLAAFTYDGASIRSYLDGKLDRHPERSPYPYAEGIHRGGDAGAGAFTVGAVSLPDFRRGHPRFDLTTTMGCTYSGLIGGLAVYERALGENEIASVHVATLGKKSA